MDIVSTFKFILIKQFQPEFFSIDNSLKNVFFWFYINGEYKEKTKLPWCLLLSYNVVYLTPYLFMMHFYKLVLPARVKPQHKSIILH